MHVCEYRTDGIACGLPAPWQTPLGMFWFCSKHYDEFMEERKRVLLRAGHPEMV